jgi:hypothetical protein
MSEAWPGSLGECHHPVSRPTRCQSAPHGGNQAAVWKTTVSALKGSNPSHTLEWSIFKRPHLYDSHAKPGSYGWPWGGHNFLILYRTHWGRQGMHLSSSQLPSDSQVTILPPKFLVKHHNSRGSPTLPVFMLWTWFWLRSKVMTGLWLKLESQQDLRKTQMASPVRERRELHCKWHYLASICDSW